MLALRVTDGTDRLDARAFRALLVAALGRTGEGMIACDEHDEIVFCCPRSAKLLERLGGCAGGLPETLANMLEEWRKSGEGTLSRRIATVQGSGALHVQISSPPGIPGVRSVLSIREEVRRDDRLYTAMHERYGLPWRAFQLGLLVRQGLTNREIARELRLSEATVKVYLHHLYRACAVRSRTALVALMDRLKESG